MTIPTIPYDTEASKWLFDPETIISRNDVLYTMPSFEPWEAMPVGGGDLLAMVRCNGGIHLHLTKSDAWGFQAPPDAVPGTQFFNNVSPGHIYLNFGKRAEDAAARFFRQRLDLFHGRIVINIDRPDDGLRFEIWGHPYRKILVVEVFDPNSILDPARIELSEWRPTMKVGCSPTTIYASEVQTRPAYPHLANTGMQNYFDSTEDPMFGRGIAVILASPSFKPQDCSVNESTVTMIVPDERPGHYYITIAASVTTSGDPLVAATAELDDAFRTPLEILKAEHQAWWRDYWNKSFLHISSPDKKADWLCAAYHVHLYTLACVNRGRYPAKWDGGAGLMQDDERTWGLGEWVQEIRFTYLPLYAANRLDIAKGLYRYYSDMIPYLTVQTRKMWDIPGLWIPETVLPWGHTEHFALKDEGHGVAGYFHRWDPQTTPYGKFEFYTPHIGFLFTAGLEICHYYLTYYRYSGDETFLRDQAYPIIRGVCEFISGLLRKENDGLYHLDPANALETWWMVRDPADTLAGIRTIFTEFIKLSVAYEQDSDLRSRCADILAALPEPPRGLWTEDNKIEPNVDVYAPAAAIGKIRNRMNAENPALYRVFPFSLSGISCTDYALVCNTFDHRICSLSNGWSMDAIWAARLGLRDQACELLSQHATRYNRFRYGGWDSNDSNVFPDRLSVVPFTDAGGLSAFALNEILLQSHNGIIRIAPAVAMNWSGIFQLRAESGFLVAADFQGQNVRFAEIQSISGKECIIENPWQSECIVREGDKVVIRSVASTIRFKTQPGGIYIIEQAGNPLSKYCPAAINSQPNQSPGLPGRRFFLTE